MKILKWLVLGTIGLILALIAVGFVLPDSAHVQRSAKIDVPPAQLFEVLNGFQQAQEWSPWAKLDPQMQISYSGPDSGKGAMMMWSSENPAVGAGNQQIIESEPDKRIRFKLFFAGFNTENYAQFLLEPDGDGTRLTWAYDTTFGGNILARYFGLMMDGMVGPDYERGLANLKNYVESKPAPLSDTADPSQGVNQGPSTQ